LSWCYLLLVTPCGRPVRQGVPHAEGRPRFAATGYSRLPRRLLVPQGCATPTPSGATLQGCALPQGKTRDLLAKMAVEKCHQSAISTAARCGQIGTHWRSEKQETPANHGKSQLVMMGSSVRFRASAPKSTSKSRLSRAAFPLPPLPSVTPSASLAMMTSAAWKRRGGPLAASPRPRTGLALHELACPPSRISLRAGTRPGLRHVLVDQLRVESLARGPTRSQPRGMLPGLAHR